MVAAAVIGSAVVGGVASSEASRHASNTAKDAAASQASVANRQLDMADEQWNRYLKTYGPLEDELAQESKDYGSEANKTKAAEEAAGTVTSSYANLRQQLNSTPGLDPSSTKYLNTLSKIGVQEAAQSAAAQTGARRQVEDVGHARMQDAVSLGKGLPAASSAALSGAAATFGSVGQNANVSAQLASQQGFGIGRMFGDVSTNPAVQAKIRGWGVDTTGPGLDVNTDPSSLYAQNGMDVDTMPSDIRLKTDIVRLGTRSDGLGRWLYRYVWGGPLREGLMAHEVMSVYPDAVIVHESGYYVVDYSKVH